MEGQLLFTILSLLFGVICIYTTFKFFGTVQLDEDKNEYPDKEGWFFSIYPRRVENKTIFFKYCYRKKWYGYSYDGYNGLTYVVYYLHNPNEDIFEEENN